VRPAIALCYRLVGAWVLKDYAEERTRKHSEGKARPRSQGGAPVDEATTTVVGIIGDDPLICRILGLLLEGAGYQAQPLDEAAVLEDPSAALAGVDLVLFLPLLGDERKGELLGVVKGGPATADVPVISLSTDLKAELNGRSDFVLPWPWSTEALVLAIEQAVHTPGGGEAPRR
jgi:hypothetical protein